MGRLLTWLRNPIVIGPPDCPILYRWSIVGGGDRSRALIPARRFSVKLHRFPGDADDRDVHDHPWAFWTLVLWGGYNDMAPCMACKGYGDILGRYWHPTPVQCGRCHGDGVLLREKMTMGKLRFRPAHHLHRTKASPRGALTLVLTGPKVRDWGFLRYGRFWSHKDYEAEFGYAMRCEDLDLEYRK